MTARNGFDPSDPTVYTSQSYFAISVQRGRELAHIISSDLTLTKDDLWIVKDQTLIAEASVPSPSSPARKFSSGRPIPLTRTRSRRRPTCRSKGG